MSITKSFNKHTGTYYAYETTYIWDDALQKKVQKKQCIGKFDPETNEIIPTGKRGRPSKPSAGPAVPKDARPAEVADAAVSIIPAIEKLSSRLISVEGTLSSLSSEIRSLNAEIASLRASIPQEE